MVSLSNYENKANLAHDMYVFARFLHFLDLPKDESSVELLSEKLHQRLLAESA